MQKLKVFLLTKSLGLYINILSFARPKMASVLAYRLFSEPRVGRLQKDRLPEVLRSTQTETFYCDGHEVQCYTWTGDNTEGGRAKGDTNVILLVHGWESNASRWEQLLPYLLQTGSTIVALDAPAHGLSSGKEFTVPRYAQFIEAAVRKFQPSTLIGHSIGGAACVYHQAHYPDNQVQKMVLLGAPSDLQTLVDNFRKLLGLNSRMSQLLDNYFADNFKIRTSEFSARIFGTKLRLKGLIAHDLDDEVVAFAEGQKIAGSWAHATFIETKGLGHSMHDDELYGKVRDFLEG